MTILVTGGCGFIGSITCVELLQARHTPIIVDSLVNSETSSLDAIERITGEKPIFYKADIRDSASLSDIMSEHEVEAVIHFAALKAVGESVQQPLRYYDNNIAGLISLLSAMQTTDVKKLIFSSSCTVYGEPDTVPVNENAPLQKTTNPYGETKQMAERIIADVAEATDLQAVNLRYFNPIGAHESGELGELPLGPPNCLVPYLTQSVAGLRPPLTVFGNDYDTPDGSCIRDYIHVVDLAKAHLKAAEFLDSSDEQVTFFNIGTGRGVSVFELISSFEKVNNTKVDYVVGDRRPGDVPVVFGDPSKARKQLGWKAEKSLDDALRDAWNWQLHLAKNSKHN